MWSPAHEQRSPAKRFPQLDLEDGVRLVRDRARSARTAATSSPASRRPGRLRVLVRKRRRRLLRSWIESGAERLPTTPMSLALRGRGLTFAASRSPAGVASIGWCSQVPRLAPEATIPV